MDPWSWRKAKLRDRIQGVILGAAIGDAVGLATEFMNKDKAQRLYGDGPIKFGNANGHDFWRDGHRSRWHENDFTDDTDLAKRKVARYSTVHTHLNMSAFNLHHVLNPVVLQECARNWLKEDSPNFDLQAIVAGDQNILAKIFCKSAGVLAGVPFVNAIVKELECSVNWLFKEGEYVDASECSIEVAHVTGKGHCVLLAERLILNVLSRCSGVATRARRIRDKLTQFGWTGSLAGSRKTTPGFRLVEKYGLMVANVDPHRYDLGSMVMLKDNHITVSGSIKIAVDKVKTIAGFSTKIEVECRNIEEALEAASLSVDIIMLDNFTPDDLENTSKHIKRDFPHILTEASGGITEENVHRYAITTVDIISTSSLVQGYEAIDFSMKVSK
ncbi:Nicotinate-nucleotide pyrophosphorylase [carboxylating], partial [Pseudolycoriella hygida]